MTPLLELDQVVKRFGGLQAVDRCSFAVAPGTITGLIGPNGAGKTTVFQLVSGLLRPDAGAIRFRGRRVVAPRPGDVVVKKWRSSAFVGTNLDMVLRCDDIKTVVVTGDVTQGCVESAARDAAFYDYYVVALDDCVATYEQDLHEASLKILRTRVDVFRSDEVVGIWSRSRGAAGPAA